MSEVEQMRQNVTRFLESAGYRVEGNEASKGTERILLYFKPNLSQLRLELENDIECSREGYGVFVIPGITEHGDLNLNHFHNFYTQHSHAILISNMGLWIINMESGAVNSLIGYPPDQSLIEQFEHPTLSSRVSSTWRVTIEEDF